MMRPVIWIISTVLVTFGFYSCLNDEKETLNDLSATATYVLTVYPTENGDYYMKTDRGNLLKPTSSSNNQVVRKQRAMVSLIVLDEKVEDYDYSVYVLKLDTILTKAIAENLEKDNDEVYGRDAVRMYSHWIGDGYLNLWFGTYWGGVKTHFVNLIQKDPENAPYELEFRHNAYNDPKNEFLIKSVAFDLSTLPDTEGETVDLTVAFRDDDSEKILKFKYNSDKTVIIDTPDSDISDSLTFDHSGNSEKIK